MIKHSESQENFYLVRCADLQIMVLSLSFEEAACEGLKNILLKNGENTNLSLIISVDKIKDPENETEVFYTSVILNDIGYFKLASSLESLSDFFLDKGENPH